MRNLRRLWSLSRPDRGLLAMTCLRKALVLRRLLSRQGIAADLCIGVRREAGRLMAHAWLELDGVSLDEPAVGRDAFQPVLGAPEGR